MRRAYNTKSDISALIPKNHFASIGIFREEPLINWTYTKTVLFTAYDIFRSSDFWLDNVIKSGKTLKEELVEIGFPKENVMIADTGIFELEAKKAGIARDLGISIEMDLSNDQIFEAYELSGADYYVSPDEIILATDTNHVALEKLQTIKGNLLELLEIFPSNKVIGVLQGIEPSRVENLFDFYRSNGVDKFAIGGIIPLYWYDTTLFERVLAFTRNLTQGHWLHTFGLPLTRLIPFYLQKMEMDSVDTSMLLYLTAKRRYLVDVESRPVRLADFERCSCEGCKKLREGLHPRQTEFFINLYIHNILEAAKVAEKCEKRIWTPTRVNSDSGDIKRKKEYAKRSEKRYQTPTRKHQGDWSTADVLLDDK